MDRLVPINMRLKDIQALLHRHQGEMVPAQSNARAFDGQHGTQFDGLVRYREVVTELAKILRSTASHEHRHSVAVFCRYP
jgi:hypothetical protein